MASLVFPALWRNKFATSILIGGGFTFVGGFFVGEVVHGLGNPLSLAALAGFSAWFLQQRKQSAVAKFPSSLEGLQNHCELLLQQFEALGLAVAPHKLQLKELDSIAERRARNVVLAGAEANEETKNFVLHAFSGTAPLKLQIAQPLPAAPEQWQWPPQILQTDHLIYVLAGQPTVADLRWLEALPAAMPLVVLAPPLEGSEQGILKQWRCQLGERWLLVSRDEPFKAELAQLTKQQRLTQSRCLSELIGSWQLELEVERRQRLKPLVQRSQWLVAAAVFASPIPSADLLLLAVVNSLLLKEMATLWRCEWTPVQLQTAAVELGRTALGLGALEWGSHALAGLLKMHGSSWLMGGGLQALSAAYLTRVVARSMADYLALTVGVPPGGLPRLKAELPLLVAKAADQEKLNWPDFAQQACKWLKQQTKNKSIVYTT